MRRLFVAVFAALLVVIGLSVVSVGTATAATPTVYGEVVGSCTVPAGARTCTITSGPLSGTTCRLDADVPTGQTKVCEKRNNPGGGFPGNGGNGHAGNGYGLPRYNSCSDYNRNGIRDIRRGDLRYNQSWDRNNNGIACDTGDVVVSSDGNCVTFVDQNRNYGNLYNQNYPTWNQLNSRNLRRENLSTADRRNLERLARDLNNYRNQWTTTSNQLRTICNDPTPPVTIINQAAAIPAPVVVTQAPTASAPAATSGSIPSGSVNTGGFSAAYMLAHNRAI